jgi:oxygen-dependent protoporphyrinogen oxidase
MNSIAIVGAGITGLTAAYALKKQGMPVTIYEAGHEPGGVIRTVRRDGFLAECGPNTLLETSPEIPALVRELGLASEMRYSDPAATNKYIIRRGQTRSSSQNSVGVFNDQTIFRFSQTSAVARTIYSAFRT